MKVSELREIAKARTAGEWKSFHDNEYDSPSLQSPCGYTSEPELHIVNNSEDWKAVLKDEDARFIASAANHIDALLDLWEATKNSPCRHTSELNGDGCPVCVAIRKLEEIK